MALTPVARVLNVPRAVAVVCLLLAAAALLGTVTALHPLLAAAVRGITPAAAAAFACIAAGQLVDGRVGANTLRIQNALACAALSLALLSRLPIAGWAGTGGQASPLMAVGLGCGGLALFTLRHQGPGVIDAMLLRWLPALGLTVIALLGIMSLSMGPQTGEFWVASFVVSPGPAAAFLLLTVCILHHRNERQLSSLREDFRISIMSLMVLTAVVVVTGIATFWAVQTRLQESEQERLVQSAYRREMAFNYQLANAARLAADMALRPGVAKALSGWTAQSPTSTVELNEELNAMWTDEFTAIRFELADPAAHLPSRGQVLASTQPGVSLEQASDMQFELQWNEGLMAYSRVPVVHASRTLGWVVLQQRLRLMTEQLFETTDLGQSVEVRLCAPASTAFAWCMPSRPGGSQTTLPLRRADRAPSAIDMGIRGEQGVMVSTDEHGTPVIDVYASVQRPLGLQLRQSIDTVTAPVRDKLKQVFVVIGVMLIAGMVILNLQVRPMALRLVLNEQRLLTVMNNVTDGIVTTDNQGHVTFLNRAAESMLGWAMADAMGKPVSEVYAVVDAGGTQPALQLVTHVLQGGADRGSAEIDLLRRQDGMRLPITDTVSLVKDRNGLVVGTVLLFHDVSAARARSAAISYEASHDALTGLINRKEFERRLATLAAPASAGSGDAPQQHSLLYIDLDKFKQVNDSAGHAAGDELLRQVTRRMHDELRGSDLFARVGGDEFTIILPGCGLRDASRIAEQIRRAVDAFEFRWNDAVFRVSTSTGVVSFEAGHGDFAAIVNTADAAAYRAKSAGRNNVQAHDGLLRASTASAAFA